VARILIVEDDADLRVVVGRALTRAGHSVVEAEDGAKALDDLGAGDYDLVFTDLEMPGRTGLEVIRASKESHPEMPVIATSGKGRPVAVALDLARRCGADAVIAKPFKLSMMVSLTERVLAGERPDEAEAIEDVDDGDVMVIMPPNLLGAKLDASDP